MNRLQPYKFRGILSSLSSARLRLFCSSHTFLQQGRPPSHFQDSKHIPPTFDRLSQSSYPSQRQMPPPQMINATTSAAPVSNGLQPNYPGFQGQIPKLSVAQLFRRKDTRRAAFRLFLLSFLGTFSGAVCYFFYIDLENAVLKEELLRIWYKHDQKDISQTVMAIHIGMLKKQLQDADIVPKSSNLAMETALNQLIFKRDEEGRLLIYVKKDYPLFDLVPFHSEYDIKDIPKFENA